MGNEIALPLVGMVLAECAQVGLMIMGKAAMSHGMSNFVFVFYSNALASLILLPSSFLFHRSERPPLTFSILCWFFLLGLLGCFAQIFGYAGIYYSSPTLGTAMLNLIPGLTFLFAVAFRMEKLHLGSSSSQAKSLGTIVSIAGAFVVTFYKGPSILMSSSRASSSHQFLLQQSNWVFGGFLLAADCLFASAWLIVQSAIVCLVMERDLSSWSFKPDVRLVAVLYSAVFGSAFQLGVSTWCLHRTGPVFVAMFKPLGIVISVIMGVIFLGDTFYLGSLLGAIVIVAGFYSVMWGKAKEGKIDVYAQGMRLESSSQKVPLLPNNTGET
ncbi:PREDICTED: WAT1-related protein At3g28050 isoform X2 [Theobroma cacao]|uniref:WAT1-related protein n=2 Tax=Theobroma cacao TaxID=3641 RepID=A0A061E5X4_THECC|nr:PREDICTED: WAT1-related protein At3g28050 isoform X2 [Theobroma cacao]EOY00425.1 Nodulin MtN21 /EamA-like transporter family protein isoform 1 [Theobroma cacao]EOY00427.1 Nodulin MtN21 /EamA-like transporter family protein isoform 1 [Theobroma cacao]